MRYLGLTGIGFAVSSRSTCCEKFGCGTKIKQGSARWHIRFNLQKPIRFVHVGCLTADSLLEAGLVQGSLAFLRTDQKGLGEELRRAVETFQDTLESEAAKHGVAGFGGSSGSGGSAGLSTRP